RLVRAGLVHELLLRDAWLKGGKAQARYLIEASQLDPATYRFNVAGVGDNSASSERFQVARDGGNQSGRAARRVMHVNFSRAAGLLAAVGAAATVLFAAYFGWRQYANENRVVADSSTAPAVARFSRSVNIEWAGDSHRWSLGDILRVGDLVELASGR